MQSVYASLYMYLLGLHSALNCVQAYSLSSLTETALNAAYIVTNSPQPTDSSSYFTEILSHNIGNTDVSALQGTVHSMASELLVITKECTDVSVLSVLKTQLQAAIATTRTLSSTGTKTALNPNGKYAPNANHTKQTFFSTKKRRVTSVNTIPKPTLEQIEQSRNKLTEEEPNFCGVCLKENDSSGDSTVYWIQCSMCAMWIHTECTNAKNHHYKLVNRMIMSVNFVQQYRCLFGVLSDQSLIIIIHMYIHIL